MQKETRTCQSCRKNFVIDPEDFAFYEKMQVPPPTWCPDCRLVRRLLWRNEINLYKRPCDLCKKDIVSMYHAPTPFPVFCSPCWWSDAWAGEEFAQEIDNLKPFFEQFRNLRDRVPHEALQGKGSVRSEYSNYTMHSKNVYLSAVATDSEDCAYCHLVIDCKECIDCEYTTSCEQCVNLTRCGFSSRCSNSTILEQCRDVHYSADMIDCESCFACTNLRHKKYYVFNQPYSSEAYAERIAELRSLPKAQLTEQVREFFAGNPRRGTIHWECQNVTGDDIYCSVNCKQCTLVNFAKSGAYLFNTTSLSRSNETVQDLYDCSVVADITLGYELVGGSKSYHSMFGVINDNCVNATYSMFCYGCTDVFGCVGLRNKSYCIFNKQYSKEEYLMLVESIRAHMMAEPSVNSQQREWGEFFPLSLSPFSYNESMAGEYFPLPKAEVLEHGYDWREREQRNYQEADGIRRCAHTETCAHQCTGAFRILPQEQTLYALLQVGEPDCCPNCRRGVRLEQRNPVRLITRTCLCNNTTHGHEAVCGSAFETSYPVTEPGLVYCTDCYKKQFI